MPEANSDSEKLSSEFSDCSEFLFFLDLIVNLLVLFAFSILNFSTVADKDASVDKFWSILLMFRSMPELR